MKMQKLSFALFLSTFILFAYSQSPSPDLIIELFRHGARGPLNQTFDPEQKWGSEIGQLTPVGMRMHYLLGAALKEEYPKIMTGYDTDKILVRSTDVNRTIMSAYAHMYGIYQESGPALGEKADAKEAIPPFDSPVIADTIETLDDSYALPHNFQVFPIHVVPGKQDYVLRPWDTCPVSSKWLGIDGTDSESKAVFENEMSEIVTFLKSKDLKIEKMIDLYYAGDNAITNKAEGLPLPGHADPNNQQYKDLKFASEWFTIKQFTGDKTQKALFALNILNYIQDHMNAALNKTSKLNYVSLSAHDVTLLNVLGALDIVSTECFLENYKSEKKGEGRKHPHCEFPQYASTLIFEFYKEPEPYLVMKYNNKEVVFCAEEGEKCTLPKFSSKIRSVTNNYTMDDFNELCGVKVSGSQSNGWVVVLIIAVVLLSAVLVYTCMDLQKKKAALATQPGQGGEYLSTP